MQRFRFSDLTRETVAELVDLQESDGEISWQPVRTPLTEEDRIFVAAMHKKLQRDSLKKMNEATVWSKAIYPLLEQAETNLFGAWSQIEVKAEYKNFIVEGIADGVIGKQKVGYLSTPYLIVVEAKREIEAKDPQPQLYGAMLAAAKMNWHVNQRSPQVMYGCYTIGESWTFLRGVVDEFEADKPIFQVQLAKDLIERFEADIILEILKTIVNQNEQN